MERKRAIKIFVGLSIILLMFPLYFGQKAKQQVLAYVDNVAVPGYDLVSKYNAGLFSSSLHIQFKPKYDYLENYAFDLDATIHHGPLLSRNAASPENYIQKGMAGIDGSIFWQNKRIQQFSGIVGLDNKTIFTFVKTPFKGVVKVENSEVLMNWRGLNGRFILTADKKYKFAGVLYPFAWRNGDNEERHVAATNLKLFGKHTGEGFTVDALDISNPETTIFNNKKEVSYAFRQTHFSLDILDRFGELGTVAIKMTMGHVLLFDSEIGPFSLRTEANNIDRTLFNKLWSSIHRVKEKLSIEQVAKESEMFLKSLPKAVVDVSLVTEQGLFSVEGTAKANKNLAKIPPSMLKIMPSYLLLRLINASAEIMVPEAFALDFIDSLESSEDMSQTVAKKVRYLYEQLRARNAIAKTDDNLRSELKLYDGTPSVNGEPMLPLIFSLMASMLLVD